MSPIRKKKPIGAIGVYWKNIHTASQSEIELVETLSAMADSVLDAIESRKSQLKSEEKFRHLFFNHSAVKLIINPDNGDIIEANKAASEFYGWPVEKLQQMNIAEINTLTPSEIEKEIKKAKSLNKTQFEFKHRKADGKIIDVEVFSSNIIIDGKNYLHSIVHDIVEKKKAEEELIAHQNRLESIVKILQYKTSDVQEFLDFALNETIALTESKIGYIYFYNEETKEFTLNSWSKDVLPQCSVLNPQTIYQLDKTGIWGEAVRQRKEIVVNDFHAPNHLKKGFPEGHAPLHKFLTVPVYRNEQIVAVVGVANKSTDYDQNNVLQLKILMDSVWREVGIRQAEKELLNSEDRFKKLSSFTFEGIIIHNNAIAIDVNQSTVELLGYERDEIIGMNLFSIIHPDYHQTVKVNLSKQVAKPYQIVVVRKDGSLFDAEIEARDISYNNEYFRVACIRDITERKRAEREVESFSRLFESSLNEIYIFNSKNLKFIQTNEAAQKNLGYSLSELQQLTPVDIKPELTKEQFKHIISPMLKGSTEKLVFETIHQRKNKSTYDVEVHMELMDFNDEKVFVAFINDITERKKADQDLRESEEKYRFLFENNPMPMWIYDLETMQFLAVNETAILKYGYSEEEFLNMTLKDIRPPEDIPTLLENIAETKGVYQESSTWRHQTKGGEIILVEIISHSIEYYGRQARLVISNDITERKQAEEALQSIEWMLSKKTETIKSNQVPLYGDLSELNTSRLILDSVGKNMLGDIAKDYLELLESSSAIYEKNGDYALGIFSSGWCRMMDQASRELCNTEDNTEALECGKWICHESCWKEASLPAIKSGLATDIECQGGIHLYALPIFAGDKVIGAINFGYGDPPHNIEKLSELHETYKIPLEELIKKAKEYETRPPYIIEMAKERLQASANLIGEIVSRKTAEKEILKLNEELEQNIEQKTKELKERIAELERFQEATIEREFRIKELREEIELLKKNQSKK